MSLTAKKRGGSEWGGGRRAGGGRGGWGKESISAKNVYVRLGMEGSKKVRNRRSGPVGAIADRGNFLKGKKKGLRGWKLQTRQEGRALTKKERNTWIAGKKRCGNNNNRANVEGKR